MGSRCRLGLSPAIWTGGEAVFASDFIGPERERQRAESSDPTRAQPSLSPEEPGGPARQGEADLRPRPACQPRATCSHTCQVEARGPDVLLSILACPLQPWLPLRVQEGGLPAWWGPRLAPGSNSTTPGRVRPARPALWSSKPWEATLGSSPTLDMGSVSFLSDKRCHRPGWPSGACGLQPLTGQPQPP